MIPDSCNGKGFDSENWAFSESHYGVWLKTRTRAVECYQAISFVNRLNGRLDDL